MTHSARVAVFGLGSMGYGIATSCLRAGFQTSGFDIAPQQVARFRADGGAGGALADIAGDLDVAVIVVLNAQQTESVLFGPDGAVPQMSTGSVIVACATVPPDFARDMEARCKEHGVHYLDAPISGGSLKAASGDLSIMASGTDAAFAAARPVLEAISQTVFELGNAAGAGSAMKAVNQLLAGVHIATMAEALTFGMTQGITPDAFLEVISKCAGTSWMLENRAPHVVAETIHRTAGQHLAEGPWDRAGYCKIGQLSAPITAAALQQYLAAAGMGLGAEDDAAVAKVYARNAGLTLPGDA